jgi:hypothetical protein
LQKVDVKVEPGLGHHTEELTKVRAQADRYSQVLGRVGIYVKYVQVLFAHLTSGNADEHDQSDQLEQGEEARAVGQG